MHATRSIDFPIAVIGPDGSTPDVTTPLSVSVNNTAVRVGVRPDDNRAVFVDGLIAPGSSNVTVSVTINGVLFSDTVGISVQAAPNNSSLHAAAPTAEYVTPTSR